MLLTDTPAPPTRTPSVSVIDSALLAGVVLWGVALAMGLRGERLRAPAALWTVHGLCTFGVAARAVLRACCDNEPEKLSKIAVRFSAPVFPGETIRTEMWLEGTTVSFRSTVPEREVTVIDHGRAEIA